MTKKKKASFKGAHPVDLNRRECTFEETTIFQIGLIPHHKSNSHHEIRYEGESLQILVVLNADGTKKLAGYAAVDLCKSLNMNCLSSEYESQTLKDSPDPKAEIIYSFSMEKTSDNVPLSCIKDEQSSQMRGNDSLDVSLGMNSIGGRSASRQKSTYLGREADAIAKIFDDQPVNRSKDTSTQLTEYEYQQTGGLQHQLSEARNMLFNDSLQDESLSRQNIRRLKLSPNNSRSQERRGNSNVKISLKGKGTDSKLDLGQTVISQSSNLLINSNAAKPPNPLMTSMQHSQQQRQKEEESIFVSSFPLPQQQKHVSEFSGQSKQSGGPGPHWRQPNLEENKYHSEMAANQRFKQTETRSSLKSTEDADIPSRFRNLVGSQITPDPPAPKNLPVQEQPQIWNSTLSFGGTAALGGSGFHQRNKQGKEQTADPSQNPQQSYFLKSNFTGSNFEQLSPDKQQEYDDLQAKVSSLSQQLVESQQFAQSLSSQHSQSLDLLRQRSQSVQGQLEEQHKLVQTLTDKLAAKENELFTVQQSHRHLETLQADLTRDERGKNEKLLKQSKLIEELTVQLKALSEGSSSWKQQQLESQAKLNSLMQSSDRQQLLEGQLREKEMTIRQLEKEVKTLTSKFNSEQNQVIVLENRVSELETKQLLSKQQESLSGISQLAELKSQVNAGLLKQEELKMQLEVSAHKILGLEDAKSDLEEQVAQYVVECNLERYSVQTLR